MIRVVVLGGEGARVLGWPHNVEEVHHKRAGGGPARTHTRRYVIQRAKNELTAGAGIAQAAYRLGFEYPQHLSRMFKRQTGMTPTAYCESLRKR